eukprot:m.449977 g.449977  ORF g.449977 m.449977 type:complete len:523 (-) comp56907_c0_seq1:860-2428(-)
MRRTRSRSSSHCSHTATAGSLPSQVSILSPSFRTTIPATNTDGPPFLERFWCCVFPYVHFSLALVGAKDVPSSVQSEFNWIANLSITHMEIFHGSLRCDNPNTCYFLRNGEFLVNLPKEFESSFIETSPLPKLAIAELKDQLRRRYPAQIFDYYPRFNGVDDSTGLPKVRLGNLEQFAEKAYDFFRDAIERHYPLAAVADMSEQETLRMGHEDVIQAHATGFVGRDADLDDIRRFVTARTNSAQPIIVMTGQTGTGKTAFAVKAGALARDLGAQVVQHFVLDAGTDAADLLVVLKRLCFELGNEEIRKNAEDSGATTAGLAKCLEAIIGEESVCITDQSAPIVIVIDDVHAVSDADSHAQSFWWIPARLHACVQVVLTAHDSISASLDSRCDQQSSQPALERALSALSPLHLEAIVQQTLNTYNKKLDPTQMESLVGNPGAGLPLWLKLACEELRVFGVFETVSARITSLAGSIDGLLQQLLERIEESSRSSKFKEALCLLAGSQSGLFEDDLRILLKESHQ